MKFKIFTVLLLTVLYSCNKKAKTTNGFMVIKGKAMGTKYEIAYKGDLDLKSSLDSLFTEYALLMSLYDSNSLVYKFNHNLSLNPSEVSRYQKNENYFNQLDTYSHQLKVKSEGAFNTGLGELYNYWGVGEVASFPNSFDSHIIDSLKYQDFGSKLAFKNNFPVKSNSNQKLNFNALAFGQLVDILAVLFESKYQFKNYYINIGGKIRVKGNNGHDSYWPIMVEKPMINSLKQIEFCTLPLKNYSLATASSLKNFHFSQGKRFSQYIDPKSGYPAKNEILSATILAPNAIEANAFASICLVKGLEKSKVLLQNNPTLKAFIIYTQNEDIFYWSSSNLAYKLAKKSD